MDFGLTSKSWIVSRVQAIVWRTSKNLSSFEGISDIIGHECTTFSIKITIFHHYPIALCCASSHCALWHQVSARWMWCDKQVITLIILKIPRMIIKNLFVYWISQLVLIEGPARGWEWKEKDKEGCSAKNGWRADSHSASCRKCVQKSIENFIYYRFETICMIYSFLLTTVHFSSIKWMNQITNSDLDQEEESWMMTVVAFLQKSGNVNLTRYIISKSKPLIILFAYNVTILLHCITFAN